MAQGTLGPGHRVWRRAMYHCFAMLCVDVADCKVSSENYDGVTHLPKRVRWTVIVSVFNRLRLQKQPACECSCRRFCSGLQYVCERSVHIAMATGRVARNNEKVVFYLTVGFLSRIERKKRHVSIQHAVSTFDKQISIVTGVCTKN